MTPRLIVVWLFLALLTLLLAMGGSGSAAPSVDSTVVPADDSPTANRFAFAVGATRPVGDLYWPGGIAVGPDGSVYVADSGNHRVQRFSAAGTFLGTWGRPGNEDGQFERPTAIGVGPDGSVFVADAQRGRLQRFGPTGAYVGKWPEEEYRAVKGLDVDRDGAVWIVTDRGLVEHRTAAGVVLASWRALVGRGGDTDGEYAGGLALAPDESVYVTDRLHDRIERYDAQGRLLATWGDSGQRVGELDYPLGIAVAADGSVYVADDGNLRVQHFDPGGTALGAWGAFGSGLGQFGRADNPGPVDIAIGIDGSVYVADVGNGRIQQFTATGDYVRHWGTPMSRPGQLYQAQGVALAPDGTLYVADSGNSRVQHLAADGTPLGAWGSQGMAAGLFAGDCVYPPCGPSDVAVSPDGRTVYAYDNHLHRVQRFTATGEFLGMWGSVGSGAGQFGPGIHPNRLAVAPDGTVIVMDEQNHRVQRFTAAGEYLSSWGTTGTDAGQFSDLSGLDVTAGGLVFTADGRTGRVQWFTLDGTFLGGWAVGEAGAHDLANLTVTATGRVCVVDRSWAQVRCHAPGGSPIAVLGEPGHGEGQLAAPMDVVVTTAGEVVVVDQDREHLARFGSVRVTDESPPVTNTGLGQFSGPGPTAVGPDGTVYVGDGSRIQRFRADGLFLGTWGAWGSRLGQFRQVYDLAVGPDQTVYALESGRLQRFDAAGRFLGQWSLQHNVVNQDYVDHLALAPDGSLVLAGGVVVRRYAPDGRLLAAWGGPGETPGKFHGGEGSPIGGVAVAGDGRVLVADTGNHRVQVFTLEGAPLAQWPVTGCDGQSRWSLPGSLASAPDGTLYMLAYQCIERVTPDGRVIALWGEYGNGEGQFWFPDDLAVAPDGTLYVADSSNNRIQVFTPHSVPSWRVELYPGRWLAERPLAVRSVDDLDYAWHADAPDPALPPDGFSLRAERTWSLATGRHVFQVVAQGGVRLWIDGRLWLDAWDGPAVDEEIARDLAGGGHRVRVEYNDAGGESRLLARWLTDVSTPTPTVKLPVDRWSVWLPVTWQGKGGADLRRVGSELLHRLVGSADAPQELTERE